MKEETQKEIVAKLREEIDDLITITGLVLDDKESKLDHENYKMFALIGIINKRLDHIFKDLWELEKVKK